MVKSFFKLWGFFAFKNVLDKWSKFTKRVNDLIKEYNIPLKTVCVLETWQVKACNKTAVKH